MKGGTTTTAAMTHGFIAARDPEFETVDDTTAVVIAWHLT
jgi:hypothetical protein